MINNTILNGLCDFDWERYNNLILNSISYEYFPKEELELQPDRGFEFLELKDEKIIYIPISKNASTSIANSFNFTSVKIPLSGESRFSAHNLDIPEKYKNGYKFFAITRDPRQRWVSGVNEFLNIYHYKEIDFDGDIVGSRTKFLDELKYNKFIFDFHTIPQLSWIGFCFKNNLDITLFKLDENLSEKVSQITKKEITISNDNTINKYKYKLKNYKFCYDILTRYCMRNEKFLDLYKMDSRLYNNSL